MIDPTGSQSQQWSSESLCTRMEERLFGSSESLCSNSGDESQRSLFYHLGLVCWTHRPYELLLFLVAFGYVVSKLLVSLKMVALEDNGVSKKVQRVRFLNNNNASSSSSTCSESTHPLPQPPQDVSMEPDMRILGPAVPQTISYVVTKPPSELIPVLANGEYKPIHRQLVIHADCRTLEIRKPTRSSSSNNNADVSSSSWEFHPNKQHKHRKRSIVPLSHVLSVSAQVPFGCKTLELTVDQSNKGTSSGGHSGGHGSSSSVVESQSHLKLMSHQVTMDNWSKHHLQEDGEHSEEEDEDYYYPVESSFDHQGENLDSNSTVQSGTSSSTTTGVGPFSISSSTTLSSIPTRKSHSSRKKYQPTKGRTMVQEYTFASEYEAASFQTMYLVLQTVGSELINLYNALELVHIRSDAHIVSPLERRGEQFNYPRNEQRANDETGDIEGDQRTNNELTSTPGQAGVALEDVYKCLGEMPFLAEKITKLYAYHEHETPKSDGGGKSKRKSLIISAADRSDSSGIELVSSEHRKRAALYRGKRRVLGLLDFVRLFVPSILERDMPFASPTAAEGHPNLEKPSSFGTRDGIDVHQERIKRLITIRKRVAEASVRVCAYKNAMDIVHDGWILPSTTPRHQTPLKRRLAFDLDHANVAHDSYAENEYYECTVGKDVQCLQSLQTSDTKDSIQAFSLVGCHMFQASRNNHNGNDGALKLSKDPILSIPSLKRIIESNPSKDFFVLVFFHRYRVATIALFVRHLPKRIDEDFDNQMDGFIAASSEERSRQLELSIQLGPKPRLSYLSLAFMRIRAFISLLRRSQNPYIPYLISPKNGRVAFPQIRLSRYSKTRHFGGSIRESADMLPSNYFAVTAFAEGSSMVGYPARLLHNLIERNRTTNVNVQDYTIRFSSKDDMTIQRAIGSIRFVHLNSSAATFLEKSTFERSGTSFHDFINTNPSTLPVERGLQRVSNDVDEPDPSELEALKEILYNIPVPVRREELHPFGEQCLERKDVQVLNVISEDDLKRHLIAAGGNMKEASIRIIQTAAWRGSMFPIDTRECRIELESGQFFMQGFDLKLNPVFYFRNMCIGPWRKDVNASILATLYRFERAAENLIKMNPDFKCTVIIFMGKPMQATDDLCEERSDASKADDGSISTKTGLDNRRWEYFVHTNFKLTQQLIETFSRHYPGRLCTVLVVPNGGWEKMIGTHGLRRYLQSQVTRDKVKILDGPEDLQFFVSADQLVIPMGGNAPINKGAFQV